MDSKQLYHWHLSFPWQQLMNEVPLVREYVAYFQQDRIHDALRKDTPHRRAVEKKPYPEATVISSPRLGGLHHRYFWREAA